MRLQGKVTLLTAAAVVFVATLLGTTLKAAAQTAVDGAVAGTVVDSTDAAVSGAAVVVHSTATNADTKVTTDTSGYFRATRLVPGVYTVMVSAPGFASYEAEHVTVEVGKLTEVTPRLAVMASSWIVGTCTR